MFNEAEKLGLCIHRDSYVQVMRDDLGLECTKQGYSVGMYRACGWQTNKRLFNSCRARVVGKEIVTVEGLARDGQLHPVQQAFVEERAFQCPHCRLGFIPTTIAFLNENSSGAWIRHKRAAWQEASYELAVWILFTEEGNCLQWRKKPRNYVSFARLPVRCGANKTR